MSAVFLFNLRTLEFKYFCSNVPLMKPTWTAFQLRDFGRGFSKESLLERHYCIRAELTYPLYANARDLIQSGK